jgi:hypothetical protein
LTLAPFLPFLDTGLVIRVEQSQSLEPLNILPIAAAHIAGTSGSARYRAGKAAPNLHAYRRSGPSRTGFEPMIEQAALLSVQCGPLSHRPDPMIKVVIRFCSVADA